MEENKDTLNMTNAPAAEPAASEPKPETMTAPAEKVMIASEKKKNKAGMIAGIVILALLAIAGLSFGVYGMTSKDAAVADAVESCTANANKNEEKEEVVEETCEGTVTTITITKNNSDQAEVKNLLSKIYSAITHHNMRFYNVYSEGTIIRISNDNFYSLSDEGYGIESAYLPNTDEGTEVMYNAYKEAEAVLTSNGFTAGDEFMWTKAYYNTNSDITCNVAEKQLPFEIYCAKNNWVANDNKDFAIELAKAAKTNFISLYQETKVKDSEVSPYQTLTAGGLNAATLFYRVSPDAEWQFFTATQGVLDCDEYTGDVAKAFAGDTCWDTNTNALSKVQP